MDQRLADWANWANWANRSLTPRRRFLLQTVSEEQEHHLHAGPEGGRPEPCGAGGAHPGPPYGTERRQQGENQADKPSQAEVDQ